MSLLNEENMLQLIDMSEKHDRDIKSLIAMRNHGRDTQNRDSDQPKADLIVMQEKIAGLFQTVAAHSNVTFGAFTAMNSLIDDLTKDVKYLAELSQKSLEDRNELSERLAVLEKHHGMP